jgi:thymidylate kinase
VYVGIILIEGLDFAGKSTLAQGLQQRLPGPVGLSTRSLCTHNPIAELADELSHDRDTLPYELSCLFFSSHLWDLRHFQAPRQGWHIQDSCWLRSKAYDRRKGLELPWTDVPGPAFDAVVFLTASVGVRQWRYRMRQRKAPERMSPADELVIQQPDQFLALEHHLREEVRQLPNVLEIDTSKLSSTETLERTWALLQNTLPVPLHCSGEATARLA